MTIADQAIVSGSNFLFAAWVARSSSITTFSTYSLIWIVVLFVNSIHMAAIVMPMFNLSMRFRAEGDRKRYLGVIALLQHMFNLTTVFICSLAWGASLLVGVNAGMLLLEVAVLAVTFHWQEFYRRMLFCTNRTVTAGCVDIIAYGGRFLVLAVWPGSLTALSAVGGCATAYFAAALTARFLCGRLPKSDPAERWEHLRSQWSAARYLLPSGLMQWLSVNFHLTVAGAVLGIRAVGVIRLGQTIVNAGNVYLQALENLVPTRVERLTQRHGKRRSFVLVRRSLGFNLAALSTAAALICAFARPLMVATFGARYAPFSYIIYWLAPVYLLAFLLLYERALLRAFDATGWWFRAYLLSSIFSLTSFYPLQKCFGVAGVLLGMLGANVVIASYSWAAICRESRT